MPQEPKRRHSTARKGKRRSAIKPEVITASVCKNCASVIVPHTVCRACGYYKDKKVL